MKNFIKLMFAILLGFYLTGCGAKPTAPNPYKSESVYLFIDEEHEDKQAMVEIFKKQLPQKSETFTMDVIVVNDVKSVPKGEMLLVLSNFITKTGMTRGVWIDYTLTDTKTDNILIKKQMGMKTRWYGYTGLTENLTLSLKKVIMVYGANDTIDKRRLTEWKDGKCVNNCNQIAKQYRM